MGFSDMFADEAKPSKYEDLTVGRFRSGHAVKGKPLSLTSWRVTSGDNDVMEVISEELGGTVGEWEATGDDVLECFTTAESVDIVLEAADIRTGMVLFGRSGPPIRSCDGKTQGGDNAGVPCACPLTLADRKVAAQRGTGCNPSISITFSLAAMPSLGRFQFRTGSWQMARDIDAVEARLAKIDGPARGTLALEVVTWTDKVTNREKSFVKPVLTILGPVADVKSPF